MHHTHRSSLERPRLMSSTSSRFQFRMENECAHAKHVSASIHSGVAPNRFKLQHSCIVSELMYLDTYGIVLEIERCTSLVLDKQPHDPHRSTQVRRGQAAVASVELSGKTPCFQFNCQFPWPVVFY